MGRTGVAGVAGCTITGSLVVLGACGPLAAPTLEPTEGAAHVAGDDRGWWAVDLPGWAGPPRAAEITLVFWSDALPADLRDTLVASTDPHRVTIRLANEYDTPTQHPAGDTERGVLIHPSRCRSQPDRHRQPGPARRASRYRRAAGSRTEQLLRSLLPRRGVNRHGACEPGYHGVLAAAGTAGTYAVPVLPATAGVRCTSCSRR
jgi:hypothetical protein